VPEAGTYSYLKRLPAAIVLLRLTAAIATITVLLAVAIALWKAPWPVDAITAVAAAGAWTSWVESQEPKRR